MEEDTIYSLSACREMDNFMIIYFFFTTSYISFRCCPGEKEYRHRLHIIILNKYFYK